MTQCGYEILPRLPEMGGGFRLRLLDGGEEVGGGVYPADPHAEPSAGIAWWNARNETERRYWMEKAGNTGRAADAWGAYLNEASHAEAIEDGENWIAEADDLNFDSNGGD